jgi:hypothetical protein
MKHLGFKPPTKHTTKREKKSWKQEILKWWEAQQQPKLDAEVGKLGQGLLNPKPRKVKWAGDHGREQEEEEEDIYVGCKIFVIDFFGSSSYTVERERLGDDCSFHLVARTFFEEC